ncbi:TraB/GumN family protein [Parabacteroides sp. OttesenSCG-928-K15]|nr:TraB/GumN family protein [Parabacteroides sp. OttesenSCG-928-K15]
MMKKVVLILVCVCLTLGASGQTKSPFNGALLWKVSGNGLEKPSYVLGTLHLFSESFVDSIPGLRSVMQEAQQVVGELDMLDAASMQAKMMQAAMLPEEESYKKLLSEAEYARLDEGLKKFIGMGLDQVGGFKPGMLAPMISIVLYTQVDPSFNPATFVGIDTYVQQVAKEEGKPIVGLETVEDQIFVLFDAAPQRIQMESLLCALENMDNGVEEIRDFIESYRTADLNKIYDASYSDEASNPCHTYSIASKPELLDKRNARWMEKLPRIMAEKTSLIAVGALHLVGEEGVLYQLDKMGYKVEPVK